MKEEERENPTFETGKALKCCQIKAKKTGKKSQIKEKEEEMKI